MRVVVEQNIEWLTKEKFNEETEKTVSILWGLIPLYKKRFNFNQAGNIEGKDLEDLDSKIGFGTNK